MCRVEKERWYALDVHVHRFDWKESWGMKKRTGAGKRIGSGVLALACAALLLSGWQGENFCLDDGRYVLEQSEEDDIAVPYLLIQEGRLTVVLAISVSYQPSGTMMMNGNEVTMITKFTDEINVWTFVLIDNNRLKFLSDKSCVLSDWESGMVFVLAEEWYAC